MLIAVTGATGFIGRYIVSQLAAQQHVCRCWHRAKSDRSGFEHFGDRVRWQTGELGSAADSAALVQGADAVVHAALYHPGGGFRGSEGDPIEFVERNVVGTLRLIEAAKAAGVGRFIFVSSCAVHDKILDDRPLDETHPLWPMSHYGAYKAAVESFVCSYGLGQGYPICSLRPTGVYGLAHPIEASKWFDLVQKIVRGEDVRVEGGGKEVHAADVAKSVSILLAAEGIAGQAYNCYDCYVSRYEVASIAKELSSGTGRLDGSPAKPRHEIVNLKLRTLGMQFGGDQLLRETIAQMVEAAPEDSAAKS
jgi:nucleoside-diphosphate-sugar epimerase